MADTVVLANMEPDSLRTTSVPVVITRAESLAIAEAIHRRVQAEQAARVASAPAESLAANAARNNAAATVATSAGTVLSLADSASERFVFVTGNDNQFIVERDMLLAEVRKIMGDSLLRATVRIDSALATMPRVMRFDTPRSTQGTVTPIVPPPAPGTTRIVLMPLAPTGDIPDELRSYGSDIANSLRTQLERNQEIDVPSSEMTRRASRGSDHMAAAWRLRADYLVTGQYLVRRDSLLVVVRLMDVRTGRFTRASRFELPAIESRSTFELASNRVLAWIDTARVSQRGRPVPR